jgi:general secretion pathway protein H
MRTRGPSHGPSYGPSRDGQAGLTLVETLVTLAIVGVMAGLVTLAAGRVGSADRAHAEAVRLAAVLGAASDAALASGRDRILVWTADGYALDDEDPRRLRAGVILARADETARPVLLSGVGAGEAATLVLRDGPARWEVAFDGLRARVAAPEARDSRRLP